jgi:hypothetical protein
VLADLMTEDEDVQDAIHEQLRYDIPLLAQRMIAVVDRFAGDAAFRSLPMGLFCRHWRGSPHRVFSSLAARTPLGRVSCAP